MSWDKSQLAFCEHWKQQELTGPISERVVRSRTFSIADFEGSRGGGFIRVGLGMTADSGVIEATERGRGQLCQTKVYESVSFEKL